MATLKKLTRVGADVRQIARLLQAKAPEGHMLAYITPEEAELLKSQGGSGEEHEDTGIPSFQLEGDDPLGSFMEQQDYNRDYRIASTPAVEPSANAPASAPVEPAQTAPVTRSVPSEQQPAVDTRFPSAPASQPDFAGQSRISEGRGLESVIGGLPKFREAFGTTPGPAGLGEGEAYKQLPIDTSKESKTIGEKYNELAKNLGISSEQLGRLGIAGVGALYNAYQSNKAQRETEAAKKEQQALGAPYQTKGAELQRAAQAGELTPEGQRQLQAVQAQAAQQAASRGGAVGAAQTQAQIEAFRSQLLQQQYDYGLKLSGIGDQIALGAIKTGLEADRYVQSLNNSFYTNMANIVGGMPAQAPQQYQQRTA